uniref:Uncharacterized protein n=1 Tax=Pseudomonas phage RVTF4 TaxID=3236931 RepID=A0AB39CCW4_9VIRU
MFAGEGSEGMYFCPVRERYVSKIERRPSAPAVVVTAIPPKQMNVSPNFPELEKSFPGFRDEWAKLGHLEHSERISAAIRALVAAQTPKEKQYFYIEKSNPHGGFWHTADKRNVIFIPDGLARLEIRDNGVEYKYKLPEATITCESWKGDLFIKSILLHSGGNAMQMYIPEDSPLLNFIKVRTSEVTTLPPAAKPYQKNGVLA